MTTNYLYITGKVPSTTTTITVGAASSSNYRWWVRSWCGTAKSGYAGYLTFNTPSPRTDEPELNEELTPLVELFDEFADEVMIDLDKDEMQIYPNPASEATSITFKSEIADNYDVQVLDLNGRVLINEKINAGEGYNIYEINTSHLAKGIYMIHLRGASRNEVKRLAVQ
ncbi:MAG: T9SS type A sorting domain-containing protein [Bacteroidetes bacterium]|nr:T9SS type A sorting domain-containing protein [Bacteroidota bacterium]